MSCNIEHRTYTDDPKLNRRGIEAQLDAYVAAADWQEGASGLPQHIKWLDSVQPFATEQEARDYLEESYGNKDSYACVAVRFYEADPEALQKDKQYTDLVARRKELNEKYVKDANTSYIRTLKAKTVTCKKCGCGIPTEHWDLNYCPVCRLDIRPKSVKDRQEREWEAINKLDERIETRRGMVARKGGKLRWLVRFAYHT